MRLGISQNFLSSFTIDEQIQAILLLTPENYMHEMSFLNLMTKLDPNGFKSHDWYEEDELNFMSTLNANINNAVTSIVVASNIRAFNATQIITIEDEQILITAVNYTTNTLTVVRWHAGTTAAAHLAGVAININGNAQAEGQVDSVFQRSPRTLLQNYFQEFTNAVDLTKRAINETSRDYEDLYGEEKQRTIWNQMRMMDRALINNIGVYDTVAWQHVTKGLKDIVAERGGIQQSTLGYANGAFNFATLTSLYQELHNRSSNVNGIMCNVATKNALVNIAKAEGVYTSNVNQGDVGLSAGVYYDGLVTSGWDGRVLPFIINKNMPDNSVAFIDTNSLGLAPRSDRLLGGDIFLRFYDENTNSAVRQETAKTEIAFEMVRADKQAFLTNLF